jgi:hypothetical protein
MIDHWPGRLKKVNWGFLKNTSQQIISLAVVHAR